MAKCPMCGEDTFFAENAKKPYLSNWWGCGTCQDTLYTRRYADRLEAVLARKDAALRAALSATEPIAIADEHDITSEEGYTSINENTRKAIVKARAQLRAAKEAAGTCNS